MAREKIKIDKGIPLPPHGRTIYPFEEMEVGDSFLVPNLKNEDMRTLVRRIAPGITYHHRNTGKKFTSRITDDGVRVWRIK